MPVLAARFRKDRQARGLRRITLQNEDVELVAVNDPFIDTEYIVHSYRRPELHRPQAEEGNCYRLPPPRFPLPLCLVCPAGLRGPRGTWPLLCCGTDKA
jgi:hypothetical protein